VGARELVQPGKKNEERSHFHPQSLELNFRYNYTVPPKKKKRTKRTRKIRHKDRVERRNHQERDQWHGKNAVRERKEVKGQEGATRGGEQSEKGGHLKISS